MLGNPAGDAYQQRMQEEAERRTAQQAQSAEQEAAARAALMPQDETQAIVFKHAEAARAEIAERARLSAQDREAEKLNAELTQISERFEQLAINPTEHFTEMQGIQKRIGEIEATLNAGQAGSQYGRSAVSTRGRSLYMVGGSILTDDTQLSQE